MMMAETAPLTETGTTDHFSGNHDLTAFSPSCMICGSKRDFMNGVWVCNHCDYGCHQNGECGVYTCQSRRHKQQQMEGNN